MTFAVLFVMMFSDEREVRFFSHGQLRGSTNIRNHCCINREELGIQCAEIGRRTKSNPRGRETFMGGKIRIMQRD